MASWATCLQERKADSDPEGDAGVLWRAVSRWGRVSTSCRPKKSEPLRTRVPQFRGPHSEVRKGLSLLAGIMSRRTLLALNTRLCFPYTIKRGSWRERRKRSVYPLRDQFHCRTVVAPRPSPVSEKEAANRVMAAPRRASGIRLYATGTVSRCCGDCRRGRDERRCILDGSHLDGGVGFV